MHTRRLRLIGLVRPLLVRALLPGERVRFVTSGARYNLFEMYLQSSFAVINNLYALVLTDQRLLLLQVHGSVWWSWHPKRAGDLKNAVPLAAIEAVEGRLQLVLTMGDGKKVPLNAIPGVDRKHLKALLLAGTAALLGSDQGMQHLCPGCLKVVPGPASETPQCPHEACRIGLRSGRRAASLSALVPGVGDLYLRHFFSGTQEYLGSLFGLGATVYAWFWAFYARTPESVVTAGIVTALLFVLPRLIDYPLTRYMARKGNVPLSYESPALAPGLLLPPGMEPVLPAFPRWVLAMFALSGVGLAAALVGMQPLAAAYGHVSRAAQAAEAQRWTEAQGEWAQAEASGWIDDNDRARMALRYLRGGLDEPARALLASIGSEPVDAALANEINELLEGAKAEPGEDPVQLADP